jgi:protein-disulfide isomerase
VVLVGGCATPGDVEELKAAQRQILERLEALEKNDQALLASLRSGHVPRAPDPLYVYEIPADGSPADGPADAAVTIVQFVDYQCPFSRSSVGLVQEILEAYPQEVRLVVKQFPLVQLHRDARLAAKAALAAHAQGKFWQMHEVLFENQRALDYESLTRYASTIGLDVSRFEADVASTEVEAGLRADMAAGRASKVTGTPTFFVQGRRAASRSFEVFKTMIDDALAADGDGDGPPDARSERDTHRESGDAAP